ncbi:MAG: NAD(P)H-dependent oxidoreductase subunit E [Thermovibrio sp.]|nr:MAG: NAD(P)H-dependent oxidoreductase subunit E [Thermovibrio sp.]
MTIEEFRREIRNLKEKGIYPSNKSYMLPSLWIAEKNFPVITKEVMRVISEELSVPLVEVEEAATFYAMYHTRPKGKYVIRVCTNLSCMLNGGEEILKEICNILKVRPGETTPDGLFTVEEYECMGLCDGAPAVTVNEDRYLKVKPSDLPEILKNYGWKGENEKTSP